MHACAALVTHAQVQEAMLTGESVPVSKDVGKPVPAAAPLGDRKNMCYSATSVVSGQAEGIVVGTGDSAEIGQISRMVNTVRWRGAEWGWGGGAGWGGDGGPPPTHHPWSHHHPPPHCFSHPQVEVVNNNLTKQMDIFGRWVALIVLAVMLASLLLARFRAGTSWQSAVAVRGGGCGCVLCMMCCKHDVEIGPHARALLLRLDAADHSSAPSNLNAPMCATTVRRLHRCGCHPRGPARHGEQNAAPPARCSGGCAHVRGTERAPPLHTPTRPR